MQKRWQLIEFVPGGCADGFTLSGSGDAGVDGRYCPDGEHLGYPRWTKVGGTSMADSIHIIMPGGPIVLWVVTSGGTYAADPLNVKAYSDFGTYTEPQPPNNTWITSAGGTFPQPEYQVEAATEVSVIRTLTPTGGGKFTRERDLSNGCIGYRRKLASELTFTGDDYKFFLTYEKSRARRCHEFTIRRQWKCGSQWKTFWTGTFSTGAGKWDLGRCVFAVKPEVLDKYSCIIRNLEKKVNALQVAPVDAAAIVIPSLEFGVCVQTFALPIGCEDFYDDGGNLENEWENSHSQIVPYSCDGGGTYQLGVYWREREQTFCVAGSPVPPVGAGWALLTDNCGADGTAIYVRNSTISWTFGDVDLVESTSAIPTPPDTSCAWTYVGTVDVTATVDPFCTQTYHHFYVCLSSGTPTEFSRARPLMEVAEYILDQSGCAYTELASDFFEHNPPGDAPGYSAGLNYVTGEANEVNSLVILQNSDAIDPAASNPATLGELKLKELLLYFNTAFQVFWDIDDAGVFRLEHWKFWTFPVGLDIADYPGNASVETLTYRHLSQEIPRYERAQYANALGIDFVGADIEYSGPCVTNEEKAEVKQYTFDPFTADIAYVISDPEDIPKQGFVILATAFDGSVYNTLLGIGALSGNTITNAALSAANLQANYWTWNRYQTDAVMNKQDVIFDGIQTNIEQKDVAVKMCCDVFGFDPSNRVLTALGRKIGTVGNPVSGYVQREEVTESDETARFTLRYGY